MLKIQGFDGSISSSSKSQTLILINPTTFPRRIPGPHISSISRANAHMVHMG